MFLMQFAGDQAAPKQTGKLILAIVILIAAGGVAWWQLGGESVADIAANRAYMCVDTNKVFEHEIQMGEAEPIESPFTGKLTAYRAEACYWTKGADGEWKAKTDPTFVVLQSKITGNEDDETVCPDCGRKVVGHNPMPPMDMIGAAEAEAGK